MTRRSSLPGAGGRRGTRNTVAVGAAVAMGVAAVLAVGLMVYVSAGRGPSAGHGAAVAATTHVTPAPTAGANAAGTRAVAARGHAGRGGAGLPAGETELATLRSSAPTYASPGGPRTGTVPATWYERPSVLPVIAVRPGWVRVRLSRRPDGATAWLQDRYVTFGSTPFRIVIDLATTTLRLYDQGRLVLSAPAGVGAADDPTPTGSYFVAFDEAPPQPNPGYGPFIMVTSAHSRTIADWEGSGDAVIGIHGPLGDDSEIGTTGARISHGCVRLHLPALARLRPVPPGTPVDIVQ